MDDSRLSMPLGEAIFTQRSIRRFRADPIPIADVHLLLEATVKAPNGGNQQLTRFLVVNDREVGLGTIWHAISSCAIRKETHGGGHPRCRRWHGGPDRRDAAREGRPCGDRARARPRVPTHVRRRSMGPLGATGREPVPDAPLLPPPISRRARARAARRDHRHRRQRRIALQPSLRDAGRVLGRHP